MKTIRVLCCCLLIFATIVMTGCKRRIYTYTYEQDLENIEKIELCAYDGKTESANLIMEFDLEAGKMLLKEFSTMDSYKHFGDHAVYFGDVVVYITYTNGEGEVLGYQHCARVDFSGKWHEKSSYFDEADWVLTLLKYVDPQFLPEVLSYLDPND